MPVIDVTSHYPIPLVWPRLAMDLKRVDAIAIHHTVTFFLKPSATVAEERAHISMIHAYHKSKGWGGFAYHLISFPSGRVYLVVPLTQWGTHVRGENDHLEAVAVAGDFTDRVPVLAQQRGVAEGIRLVYAALGRQVSIRPHRSWTQTACPGATWQQWVPGLTALVEEEDEDMPVIVRNEKGTHWILHGRHKERLTYEGLAAYAAAGVKAIKRTDAQLESIPDAPAPTRAGLAYGDAVKLEKP